MRIFILMILCAALLISFQGAAQAQAKKPKKQTTIAKNIAAFKAESKKSGYDVYFSSAKSGAETTTLLITPKAAAWRKLTALKREEIAHDWLFMWVGIRREFEKDKDLAVEIVGVKEIIACTQMTTGEHGCLYPR